VPRVHRETPARGKVRRRKGDQNIGGERFEDISAFERLIRATALVILKFFLNITKEEQRKRFSNGWRRLRRMEFRCPTGRRERDVDPDTWGLSDLVSDIPDSRWRQVVVPADQKMVARGGSAWDRRSAARWKEAEPAASANDKVVDCRSFKQGERRC